MIADSSLLISQAARSAGGRLCRRVCQSLARADAPEHAAMQHVHRERSTTHRSPELSWALPRWLLLEAAALWHGHVSCSAQLMGLISDVVGQSLCCMTPPRLDDMALLHKHATI
jgi:hypothetical protein